MHLFLHRLLPGFALAAAASISTQAYAASDLAAVLSSESTVIGSGGEVIYSVGIKNNGPDAAPSDVVEDFFAPNGGVILEAWGDGWTCEAPSATKATCSFDTPIFPGSTAPFFVRTLAPAQAGNSMAFANVPELDTVPSNNTASLVVPVIANSAAPDLQVTFQPPDVVAMAGEEFVLSVQLQNKGAQPSSNTVLRARLPAGVELLSVQGIAEPWSCDVYTSVLFCKYDYYGQLQAGQNAPPLDIHAKAVTLTSPMKITAFASSASGDAQPSDNLANASVHVLTPPVELSAWIDQPPAMVAIGTTYTYTVAVHNAGNTTDGSVMHVVGNLAGGSIPGGGGLAGWSCQIGPIDAGSHFDCTHAGLASSETSVFTLQALVTEPGIAELDVTVQGGQGSDVVPGNDSDSAQTQVQGPDIALSQLAPNGNVLLGSYVDVVLTASNVASLAQATSVTVKDTLPAEVSVVSASGTGWTCDIAAQTVTCNRANLAAASTAPAITLHLQAVAVGLVSNTATVSTPHDTSAANDSSGRSFRIIVPPNNPPQIPAGQAFSIPENAAIGAAVGTVAANDADTSDTLTYSMPQAAALPFDIVATTGSIVVDGTLDHETAPQFASVDIQVSDGKSIVTQTVSIAVTDIGGPDDIEHLPAVPPGQHFTVRENVPIGAVVGMVQASDADPDDTLVYSLTNAANLPFAINAASGQLTVDAPLDFETTPAYPGLEITVTDGTTLVATAIDIAVQDFGGADDVNVAPVIVPGQVFHVRENALPGALVGHLQASDADLSDVLVFGMPAANFLPFSIDTATGALRVDGPLDFETAPRFSPVVVTVDDGTAVVQAAITVIVDDFGGPDDQNDAPTIAAGQVFHVAENAPPGTTIGLVHAADPDLADTLVFVLPDDPSLPFAIDATTGALRVDGALDFETQPDFPAVQVQVSDGLASGSQTVVVLIDDIGGPDDVNDAPVVPPGQSFQIIENAPPGAAIGTVAATDADPADVLTFTLAGDALLPFTVDADSGQLRVDGLLDFETAPLFAGLLVQVSDGTATTLQTITIRVTDFGGPDDGNNNGNAPPVANDDFFDVPPGVTTTFAAGALLANDMDDDGDPLSATLVGTPLPAGVQIIVQTDGGFSVRPPAGMLDGIVDFDYEVTDGHGGTAQAHVAILVGESLFHDGFE